MKAYTMHVLSSQGGSRIHARVRLSSRCAVLPFWKELVSLHKCSPHYQIRQ